MNRKQTKNTTEEEEEEVLEAASGRWDMNDSSFFVKLPSIMGEWRQGH